MTERESPRPEAPLFGRKGALWLAAALLCGIAAIALLGIIDRKNVAALEHFAEVTAVGDTVYFNRPPDARKPPPAAATLNGEALYPVSYKKIPVRDTKMVPVARDAASGLTIYTSREPILPQEEERERPNETFYFLKHGPNEYVKVRPGTPGK